MLNQTLPSKENSDVLFTLHYTVPLKDYNSYVSHCVVMLLMTRLFLSTELMMKIGHWKKIVSKADISSISPLEVVNGSPLK